MNVNCWSPALGSGCGNSGLDVFALDRLDDHAVADGLGADLDANDLAVDDGSDLLDVGAELAGSDAGDFGSDAAQVLGLAAMGDLVSEGGFLTGKMANAWHC